MGIRRTLRDRTGAAMLEFAIIGPTVLLFIFGVFGVGVNTFYQQVLDDAVRDAARQVQMDDPAAASGSGFVSAVCAELGILASTCQNSLTYAVQSAGANGTFASLSPQSLNAAGSYPNSFFAGNAIAPGAPILVQAAFPLPFKLPYVGNLLTGTGTASIVSAAAVLAEPYQ